MNEIGLSDRGLNHSVGPHCHFVCLSNVLKTICDVYVCVHPSRVLRCVLSSVLAVLFPCGTAGTNVMTVFFINIFVKQSYVIVPPRMMYEQLTKSSASPPSGRDVSGPSFKSLLCVMKTKGMTEGPPANGDTIT